MATRKAPLLDAAGKKSKDVTLADEVFGQEIKPHLLHEAVRAEAAAARSGTQSTKSRGLVSGGRSKPWRQKGTGRARAGTTRAAQWTGGGHAFALRPRSYAVKVNRKTRKAAFRAALSHHAERGSLALLDPSGLDETPSTRKAADLIGAWKGDAPVLVVVQPDQEVVAKSFRNLDRVLVVEPSELEVGALVWARSVLVTEDALARVEEITR